MAQVQMTASAPAVQAQEMPPMAFAPAVGTSPPPLSPSQLFLSTAAQVVYQNDDGVFRLNGEVGRATYQYQKRDSQMDYQLKALHGIRLPVAGTTVDCIVYRGVGVTLYLAFSLSPVNIPGFLTPQFPMFFSTDGFNYCVWETPSGTTRTTLQPADIPQIQQSQQQSQQTTTTINIIINNSSNNSSEFNPTDIILTALEVAAASAVFGLTPSSFGGAGLSLTGPGSSTKALVTMISQAVPGVPGDAVGFIISLNYQAVQGLLANIDRPELLVKGLPGKKILALPFLIQFAPDIKNADQASGGQGARLTYSPEIDAVQVLPGQPGFPWLDFALTK